MLSTPSRPLAAALAVVLCACAASPESIKVANYNSSPYAYLDRLQLAQYKAMLNGRLVKASSEQDNARMEGMWSVTSRSAYRLVLPATNGPMADYDPKGRIVAVERVETADLSVPDSARHPQRIRLATTTWRTTRTTATRAQVASCLRGMAARQWISRCSGGGRQDRVANRRAVHGQPWPAR